MRALWEQSRPSARACRFLRRGGWRNTGRPKVASEMKTSHSTGSNGAQVGSVRTLCNRPRRRTQPFAFDADLRRAEHVAGRMKLASRRTSLTPRHSESAGAPAKLVAVAQAMMSRVSCVASTAPCPARAWSEWPCVIKAFSTGRVGSIGNRRACSTHPTALEPGYLRHASCLNRYSVPDNKEPRNDKSNIPVLRRRNCRPAL